MSYSMHANGTGASAAIVARWSWVGRTRKSLTVLVNELPLEQYVAGVVPNELGALVSALLRLQAMSVIARTFALSHLRRHEASGYDVCSTVHCQVYGGLLSEWISSNAAVAATQGQVVYYGDQPADTTFHALCGGVGEAIENVWP